MARNATIILFEEEPSVRVSMAYQLTRAGYDTHETGSCHEVLELCMERRRAGERFHLLVVGMTPLSLAMIRQLRMNDILLPVLMVLDYPHAGIMQLCKGMRGTALLVRPFSPDELLQALAGLLDGRVQG